ncbi:UDP-3-O-(3-hydroxymyristoyl)glucosamine N-acyltransferase [Pseudocolwellia sp. AS88]|jgi:UDP-3-O-[3-hydroxymyristoyl] glucosamine N-acyltransferase|uniref:UDP-3-O-(3-hydroxymyristoyl)glucosamine N-acyltransferase n=1 Tax=Pseudocolwellia TaxID=2848177 RepID=UPI0026E986F7|nr:UDP-3-O-(3-hydroxymyristoyl)glucosamine N-acyltransferase [Pseudocolwellia sp. AS88]MDO7083281.1 UDP-3-O-(3-hydroxymyristoyl)glucosamine N-acyltransferase [Pseudocolwellia sp. AS88]
MSKKSFTLAEIAKEIGATVNGDENCEVNSLATLLNAQPGQIAFLANKKYRQQLNDTKASAVIITADCLEDAPTNALVMDNPYLGYALAAQLLDTTPKPANGIHPSAVVDSSATIGNNVSIGANAVIESGVTLSDNVSIGAGCFIGKNATIGNNSAMWANVSIYHEVKIGNNCLIQSNTVIGSDGFGYAPVKGKWLKIPQLGSVIIGDNVEIGASTTIDRGALDDTIIEDNVILDNQIQIAHNVTMGAGTAMAACSVIAGSTTIGKNCTIAGLVGVNGHINITDNCMFTGMSMVTKSMTEPGVYSSGMPALPNKEWHKMNARVRKLDSVIKRLSTLESEILEKKK